MKIAIGNPSVGDAITHFELTAANGDTIAARTLDGKWTILAFYPSEQVPVCAAMLDGMRDAHQQLSQRGVGIIAISLSPMEKIKAFTEEHRIAFPILSDSLLQVSSAYGALRPRGEQQKEQQKLEMSAQRRLFVVSPDRRIARIYDNPSEQQVAQLPAELDALLSRDPPRRMVSHAPVLLVSNVLPADLCKRLIQIWHDENTDSGFMKEVEGQTVGVYDYSHKIRRDHFMKDEPELAVLKKLIGARVIPALQQAFNYEVSRFEDFRIACYDASRGGYFRPHRDNTTEGTAHRRFAMSLLLNDDYQGGARFPEYGLHEYRPDAGSAVVFSCSLLHEATDVTAGLRFVLLSFFYGEKEAKLREEYSKRTGGEYRATKT